MSSPEERGESDEAPDGGPGQSDQRLDESIASQARLAPRRIVGEFRDPRPGGDASKAPASLSATERHPIEGASSGISWDDPDEL
ncbi:hypothetical protein [Isoptericola sp. BMS4]|uniref:hypothetical protein n=1 Tax=Isoptericola sp. BMS4 TaxID=2527875 RepID=UPI0014201F34|nr:hypothetical protein [Isoptericola sp. BMS4]